MKKQTYIIIILLLIILNLVGFRSCEKLYIPVTLINSDSIAQLAYSKGYEIAKLEEMGKVKDSIQTHYVTKWKVYREKATYDTILQECVTNCDSALNTQFDYICYLETTSAHKDTSIVYWRSAYRGDSTNVRTAQGLLYDTVKYFNKRVRRGYIKGFLHGFTAGNVTGGCAAMSISK